MFGWLKKKESGGVIRTSNVRSARRLFRYENVTGNAFYCGSGQSDLLYRYGYLVCITENFTQSSLWDNPQLTSWKGVGRANHYYTPRYSFVSGEQRKFASLPDWACI